MQFNIYKMKDKYNHIIEYYLQDRSEDNIIYSEIFSTSSIFLKELSVLDSDVGISRSGFFIKRKINENGQVDWAYRIDSLKNNSDVKVFEENNVDINKIITSFFGIYLFELTNNRVYAISFGYASSLLNKYCDSNFGLDLAERILNDQAVDVESVRFLNVNRKKSLTVFSKDAVTGVEYGSAKEYIEGHIDKEIFAYSTDEIIINKLLYYINKKFDFGTSIKFTDRKVNGENMIDSLEDLSSVIVLIDYFIEKNQDNIRLRIPRLSFISSKEPLSKELDRKLLEALEKKSIDVGIDFYSVVGADIIINSSSTFTLTCTGVSSESYEDLSIENVMEFLNRTKLKSPHIMLDSSRVKFDDGSTRALKRCLMADVTYGDQIYILVDGKWATYNDTFMKYLEEQIKEIIDKNIIEIKNSPSVVSDKELANYYKNSKKKIKHKYREYIYNTRLADEKNMLLLDREMHLIEKYPNVEIADLLGENELIHVKIGDTGKFIENIEQSMLAATIMHEVESKKSLVKNSKMKKQLIDEYTVAMLLVYKNRHVEKFNLKDINSIKFKASLIEWYKKVISLNLKPKIYITSIENCAQKFSDLIN